MAETASFSIVSWSDLTSGDFDAWREFASRRDAAPDLYPEWTNALIVAQQMPTDELRYVRLSLAGAVRACWPIRLRTGRLLGIPFRIVEPVLSVFALHQEVLSDLGPRATVSALIDGLTAEIGSWTVLRVSQLTAGYAWADAWLGAAAERRFALESTLGRSPPYLVVDCTWEVFLARKSANFRSNLKRKARKLREQGRVSVDFIWESERMAPALKAVAAIEERSWKAESGTSLTSRPWEQRFYEVLVAGFAPSKRIVVSVLRLNDEPIAYDMSVVGGKRAYCLKTSFDARHGELAPGLVLRGEIMRWVFESGLSEYDFLGDNERYKLEWTDTVRRDLALSLVDRGTLRGRLLAVWRDLARWRGRVRGA